ncbi:MAG TPA: M50 family metallopeptidase [Candidatus Binatia bacterium]|nr:M50 family metallopeptidase [Candidatus Binatia bacterium]
MPTSRQGSIRLFRFSGIDVFLHWSWFLVAAYEISTRKTSYSSLTWNVLEYLALFLIVTLHEFGHALACRQVGGTANQIVLWPLGGIAYVNPPQRPGATLWSIAAGPLVNVAIGVILYVGAFISHSQGLLRGAPDLRELLNTITLINFGLLIFNILPIYPLDGGQILRSLLWFVLGRARSLMVAAGVGLLGAAGFIYFAFRAQDVWLGAIAVFVLMNSWSGLQQARALSQFSRLPRRQEYICPTCKASPPIGQYWKCTNCGQPFDTFQTGAVCPACGSRFEMTRCTDCGASHPMAEWSGHAIIDVPH